MLRSGKTVRATTSTSKPRDADRPTLLMVGSGEPMDVALRLALDRHGLFVEAVGLDDLRPSVQMTAPDLVLLLGDAAEEGGVAALKTLAADPGSAAVPVVLLASDGGLENRMHAFRHGAMAVVPRSASPDGIARKVASLTRELSEHFEERTGEIGEATFDELVDLVKKELRSGILSIHAPNHKGGPMRLVLGAGRPVAQAVHEFVARIKPHVTAADAMYYQFHTSAGGPVELLDMDGEPPKAESLTDLRILLVDDDPARADALAQELRSRSALVFVTDNSGRGIERAVGLDPQVAIIDAAGLEGAGFEVVRTIRKDLRLRWASILVAPWEEIWPEAAAMPDIDKLAARMEPLLVPERELAERARGTEPFDVRLESTGPGRMLRVLVASGATLHLTIRNPKAVVEVDLAQGLLVGATARSDGRESEGTAALAILLTLGSARVHVERRSNPAAANVMAPVDEALAAATSERASEPSSIRPAPTPAKRVPPPPKPKPEDDSELLWDGGAADSFDSFADLADELPAEQTQVRNLEGLAKAGELLAAAPSQPQRKRRPTMTMGSPLMSPLAQKVGRKPPTAPSSIEITLDDPEEDRAEELAETVVPEPPEATIPKATLPKAPPLPRIAMPGAGALPPPPATLASTDPAPAAPPDLAPPDPPERTPLPPDTPPPPSVPRVVVPPEPTLRVTNVSVPEPRKGIGRALATMAVTLASLVLISVLGLIAYRYSDLHHPGLDRALVLLGTPPREPVGQVPAPPQEELGLEPAEPAESAEPAEPAPAEALEAPSEEPDDSSEQPEAPSEESEAPSEQSEAPVEEAAAPSETFEEPAEEAAPAEPAADVELDPEATNIAELLRAANRAGSSDLAVRIYRRILELDPREHHAMIGLAAILMERGAPAEAAELLEGAVRRRPRRAHYRVLLGDALAAAGDQAGARGAWERALESEPDNARALRRLGR